MPVLKIFKLTDSAIIPALATSGSACFDLHADLPSWIKVKVFDEGGVRAAQTTTNHFLDNAGLAAGSSYFCVHPGQRALIPTGLVMDIPTGYSVRLHPRSGIALKQGLTLINAEGVVDSDYVEEVCAAVINLSTREVMIEHGDRICQAELVRNIEVSLAEINERPGQKTTRVGGFGSTDSKQRQG